MNRYFGTHTLEGEWHALLPRYLLLGERVRGSRVLDVGCGTGIGSSLLLELGAESVHGIDHRPEVLQLAKVKHDKQGLDFHVMFWEELNFPDDHFDMVVCLDPASPITDPNLLMEVRRVLCDGGEYICALERTKVSGLEEVLPRYGYTSSADQISIGRSDKRVPQIGELSTYFDTIVSIVQRPHISYVFEPESPRGGGDLSDGEEMRRISDSSGEGGLWHSEETTGEPQAPRESGRWVPVDRHLSSDDAEVAAVEIYFCGDAHLPPPPLREIRLPYYNIVERLEQLVGDLQMRQNLGGEPSSFDEVLDEPIGAIDDSDDRTTTEFDADPAWDDEPTGVRERPTASASQADAQGASDTSDPSRVVQLESQLNHLSELYKQVRSDFDRILDHTKAALSERDEYIDHLVQTVHEWEEKSGGDADEGPVGADSVDPDSVDPDSVDPDSVDPDSDDAGFSETAKTGVFKVSELQNDGEEPLLDELSADESSEPEGLGEDSSEPEGLGEDSSDAEESHEEASDDGDNDNDNDDADADDELEDSSDTDDSDASESDDDDADDADADDADADDADSDKTDDDEEADDASKKESNE